MTTATKPFSLAQILSITHDRLLVEVGEVYEILNWLTSDNLFTHQLPRAAREAKPILLERFPDLADIDIASVTIESFADVHQLVESLTAAGHAATRELAPLDSSDHTRIDPISELKMMKPDVEIVTVNPDTGETRHL